MILCNTVLSDIILAKKVAVAFSQSDGYSYKPIYVVCIDVSSGRQYLIESTFSEDRIKQLNKNKCTMFVHCVYINGRKYSSE